MKIIHLSDRFYIGIDWIVSMRRLVANTNSCHQISFCYKYYVNWFHMRYNTVLSQLVFFERSKDRVWFILSKDVFWTFKKEPYLVKNKSSLCEKRLFFRILHQFSTKYVSICFFGPVGVYAVLMICNCITKNDLKT